MNLNNVEYNRQKLATIQALHIVVNVTIPKFADEISKWVGQKVRNQNGSRAKKFGDAIELLQDEFRKMYPDFKMYIKVDEYHISIEISTCFNTCGCVEYVRDVSYIAWVSEGRITEVKNHTPRQVEYDYEKIVRSEAAIRILEDRISKLKRLTSVLD